MSTKESRKSFCIFTCLWVMKQKQLAALITLADINRTLLDSYHQYLMLMYLLRVCCVEAATMTCIPHESRDVWAPRQIKSQIPFFNFKSQMLLSLCTCGSDYVEIFQYLSRIKTRCEMVRLNKKLNLLTTLLVHWIILSVTLTLATIMF